MNMNNKTRQNNSKYTLEFKQDAVSLVLKNGYTRQRAADHLGVSLSALSRWVKIEKGGAQDTADSHSTLNLNTHAELVRLRKENEQLRMEREILKKAAVFFAKETE